MRSIQIPFVSISLARLRRGVTLCCWILGLALTTQLLVFGTAAFLDVRYQVLEDTSPGALIVSPSGSASSQGKPAVDSSGKAIDANHVLSKNDKVLERASTLAYGAGMLGLVLLIPLVALGAMLAAGSATPGVERTVSAFMWSLAIAAMTLPIGESLGLPWREGALVSYANMTSQVDLEMGGAERAWGSPLFYCRFALLPLTCLVGVTLIGMGFSAGVYAGIMPKEDNRLDPMLERETSNITPGSLHGGRAAVALRSANVMPSSNVPVAGSSSSQMQSSASSSTAVAERKPAPPSITQLSPGDAPKRLI